MIIVKEILRRFADKELDTLRGDPVANKAAFNYRTLYNKYIDDQINYGIHRKYVSTFGGQFPHRTQQESWMDFLLTCVEIEYQSRRYRFQYDAVVFDDFEKLPS